MRRRLFVEVSEDTFRKVADSAQLDRRSVRDQAAVILERALVDNGGQTPCAEAVATPNEVKRA